MKTAKELCIECKARVGAKRIKDMEQIAEQIINRIEMNDLSYRGDASLTLQNRLEYDTQRRSGVSYGAYEPITVDTPRTLKRDHLLELLRHNPEAEELLKNLGYKVTWSTVKARSHSEFVPQYQITPEKTTFWGKVIPAHSTLVGMKETFVDVDLDTVTISACCGEEK